MQTTLLLVYGISTSTDPSLTQYFLAYVYEVPASTMAPEHKKRQGDVW